MPLARRDKLCFFIYVLLLVLGSNNNVLAQACDYLPGAIHLVENGGNANTFYTTKYLLVNQSTNTITQINTRPTFNDLEKGDYAAYAINYKTRDSIFNLEIGNTINEIASACMHISPAYHFDVCAPPLLSSIEMDTLALCSDGTFLQLSNTARASDEDDALDTFSIVATIIGEVDLVNDYLEVDLGIFNQFTKSYTAPSLTIENIDSPSQVQAILRGIYFYSNSGEKGIRTIQFQISDGRQLSNVLTRSINITPLPAAPTMIFRKN